MTHILKSSYLSAASPLLSIQSFTDCIARMEGNSVFPLLLLLLLLLSASRCSDAQLPLPRLDPRSPLTSHHHNQGLPSLLALLKTLPKSTRGSGIPLRPCSFKATTQRLESGTCTWYGACRFQGRDYMYQVRFTTGYLLSQILEHIFSTRPISMITMVIF